MSLPMNPRIGAALPGQRNERARNEPRAPKEGSASKAPVSSRAERDR
jgi:hypothetical protein